MFRKIGYLVPILGVVASLILVEAPSASADCNYSGGSTLCSSTGTVRGGSAPPPQTFDPYPCGNGDPLCMYYDDWDPQIYIDRPGNGPGRPNRPGGGGGGIDPGFNVRPGRGR